MNIVNIQINLTVQFLHKVHGEPFNKRHIFSKSIVLDYEQGIQFPCGHMKGM